MAASSETNNELYSSNPSSLPLDVVSDILLLLPVKTLSRLKLVSKSWLSLISSPSFRSSHRRRSERNPLLLVATSSERDGGRTHFHALDYYKKRGGGGGETTLLDRETTGYDYPPAASRFHRRLVCSLDLICVYDLDDIYIRNPATGEQIALPRKSSGSRSTEYGFRAVAFAYLPSTGEYKVLRVLLLFGDLQRPPIFRSEVFTLGSGRWREIKEGAPFWVVYDENSAVVDEAVHFLPAIWRQPVGNLYHDDDDDAIARFDLKKEEWSKLPLPDIRHFSRDLDGVLGFRLKRLGGSLCMECSAWSRVDLWLLEEGRDSSCASWVKVYSIDRCCYPHPFRIVDAEKDGRALLERSDGKLQVHNTAEERVEATIFSSGKSSFFGVSSYVESFMTLDDESFESLKKQAVKPFYM